MDLSIVKILPDDAVVKALCNTLIQSLWQGLLLAAIAGLIITFTRKATSATRYNLLVTSLLIFACGAVYTFISQLHIAHVNTVLQTPPAQVVPNIANYQLVKNNPNLSLTNNFISYFNNHANSIVLVWLLIVCARSIQLLTGLNSLYHLKRKAFFEIDEVWKKRVAELSVMLGINRLVAIAESGMAQVPMVIGHFKPVILIPMGLITALSPAEIDAILVHELAHIRRRDYLVNLLQSFMEIVFFFNPAVLWISTLIKTERENCCDDITIAQTSSKVNYIKALVTCQEYQLSAPAYAMALSGNKNNLLGRVKRMVSNNNHSLNGIEKSLLAVCLLIAGLFTTAFTNTDNIHKLITTTTKAVVTVSSVVKKEIVKQETVEPENNEVKVKDNSATKVVKDTTPDAKAKLTAAINMQIDKQMKMEVDSAKRLRKRALMPLPQSTVPAAPAPMVLSALSAVPAAPALPALSPLPAKVATHAKPPVADKADSANVKIIKELMADGIITSKNNLSFKLSTSEFVVNNKKQPDNIYQKYRSEYVPSGKVNEWSWYYNFDTTAKKQTERQSVTTTN